ncbi:hypothetical protein HS088_TW14G00714 [Tripterygium wilfordii]|uniref:V-SNARE coiled-coil homology domain-containing protein n=1 Tax=Tripterygium wilfordii TaxID=458696 RepID=A0A7J7CRH9_TRIWF|nr:uncharacterized protein LOC120015193 [Tripterygium wilfordii]KAF5736569.1 hypothetical protein HS088_TW14G00714 [Tripterygium wilfordii]
MFARFFQKNVQQQEKEHEERNQHHQQQHQPQAPQGSLRSADLNPRITIHYGIPATASVLAFDAIQSLLAVGTLDGRIKVIGGDNIEALLVSPKQLPFKNLEFMQNKGFLASISNENEIQVWDLECRQLTSALQWESNITAFSVICGTSFMYVGDEYGMVSVLKYDAAEGKLVLLPYYVPTNSITEASGISLHNHSIVGILPQPCSQGSRLLMAYENGLIVIWDVSEDRVVLLRGNKVLEMKSEAVADSLKGKSKQSDELSEDEQVEKEISSLCWASTNGSILAAGYVDGDIMFWDLSTAASSKDRQAENSSNNVVKLQLSSGAKRLPVIVLHWSAHGLHNDRGGQLFVYGGNEVGSEEVLTILSIDQSSGIKSLKCIARVDLRLNGSFADMVLLRHAGMMGSSGTMLLVLTNPGNLHFYNDDCLSELMSLQEKAASVSSIQYPRLIPAVEPCMTTGKLAMLYREGKLSRILSEIVSAAKFPEASQNRTINTEWPLTGGVPSLHFSAEDYQIERIYCAGYQDGSVRIWDATYPTLLPIYVLGSEVEGIEFAGASESVSVLEFCSSTLSLAIGNACGVVRLYNLIRSPDETSLNFIMETERKVHILPQSDGPQCTAIFSFLNSPVCSLQFANFGRRLAIGFKCGRVAMVDTSSLSVLYLTEDVSSSSSTVYSLAVKSFSDASNSAKFPKNDESKCFGNPEKWELFIMTKDAHVIVCDGTNDNIVVSKPVYPKKESTAVSLYIIDSGEPSSELSNGKHSLNLSQISEAKAEPVQSDTHHESAPLEVVTPIKSAHIEQRVANYLVLLCCEDALRLYPFKSVYQGDSDSFREVNLSKPCCWTATIKKEEKHCALIVFYRTGEIEIRCLPNLEVLGECSLMSILRWNFKTDMENTTCSSDSGQIMLVNGSEFASISLLASENDFRIPASLPCLHDKVLAAAFADASAIPSNGEKKIQGPAPGFLGGIIRGFNVSKMEENVNLSEVCESNFAHLEDIFSYPPFLKPSLSIMDDQDIVELDIDDIQIDGPVVFSSSSKTTKNDARDKETERQRLFEGATTDARPKARTAEEIRAKYRKEDVSGAAARAKDKLIQRQEKLERLSLRTEELQSGAENFASMANELAKTMEKRKWWNI